MKLRTYKDVTKWLFAQLPMYQRIGKVAFKKDLSNITALLKGLDNPQTALKVIHIAGTNGKGTVSHLISSVLQTAGFRVGLYTSPHYVDFRERIKINGLFISEEQVVDFVQKNADLITMINPSFFEITVAMAFNYFSKCQVDIAVIETGLGGRLDSTNVVNPLISVITNISLDHCDMLGDDIYTIAGEKAGIIKQGRPVVIGKYQPECDAVFYRHSHEKQAPISFASLNWNVVNNTVMSVINLDGLTSYNLSNQDGSPFFEENTTTAIETLTVLREKCCLEISDKAIEQGINDYRSITNYTGRWMQLSESPMIIADSAHNDVAIKAVLERLRSLPNDNIHFVVGFVSGKDLDSILRLFPRNATYYFVKPNVPRGLDTSIVVAAARKIGIVGHVYESIKSGIAAARKVAELNDIIYIGGSSFVVAEAI